MTTNRIRLDEIVFFKAFCILAVLAVHSTSQVVMTLPPDSGMYMIYHWMNRFFKFGTPLFLFISAFTYFHAYARDVQKPFNWKIFMKSRINFVLIPFVIFSLLYYLVKRIVFPVDLSWSEQILTFFEQLVTGKTYTHLYYILVVMQFYVLFAWMIRPIRERKTWLKWMFPVTLGVHISFLIINHELQWIEQKGSLFISYLSFFTLGGWVGTFYSTILEWYNQLKNKHKIIGYTTLGFFTAVGYATFTIMWSRQYAMYYKQLSLWIELSSLLYFLPMSILVFVFSRWVSKKTGRFIQFIRQIGEVSFGIYLIHPFVLMGYRALPISHGSRFIYMVWVGGGYVAALAISLGIILLLRNVLMDHASFTIGMAPPKPVNIDKNGDRVA